MTSTQRHTYRTTDNYDDDCNRYVLKRVDNPQIDKYREVVLRLFVRSEKGTVKKQEIKEAIKTALNEEISPGNYKKVLSEFAVCKGNIWCFKVPIQSSN